MGNGVGCDGSRFNGIHPQGRHPKDEETGSAGASTGRASVIHPYVFHLGADLKDLYKELLYLKRKVKAPEG